MDEDAMLRRMFKAGASFGAIGREVNKTRYAAESRARRLGLTRGSNAITVRPPADRREGNGGGIGLVRAARTGQVQRKGVRSPMGTANAAPPALPLSEPRAAAFKPLPGSVPVGLLDRTGCAWPVGEGPTLFCNAPKAGKSYCAAHETVYRGKHDN